MPAPGRSPKRRLPFSPALPTVASFPSPTPTEGDMGELCERMRGDLEIAGFSPSTSRIYLMCARHFARCHMRNAAELGRDDVREFLLHLAERKESSCTMRQVRASLTLL